MEIYQSNSHKSKEAQAETPAVEKRKVEKVVVGQVKTKKKSGLSKVFGNIVSEDARDIKSYLVKDIVIPTIKKTITETVDMILYGGSSKSRSSIPFRVSYRSYYDEPRTRDARTPVPTAGYSYDDIIIGSRGEAEEVLSALNDMIDTYQIASVADLYDLVGLTGNYTDNKYGWTNLSSADVIRVRDGYMLKLPKAMPIK